MSKVFWFGIAIVVGVSLGITFFAPINDVYKGIASLPGVAGLAAALFQLIRDHAAHQRNLEIQQGQQLFNLGATSHMANSVFDKHVEFCERYLAEVHQTVVTLTREGPTREALKHAGNLYTLRIEYTAWITPEMDEKLMPFEKAVRKIGANSGLVSALSGEENRDGARTKALEEMYDVFSNLMGIGDVKVKDEDATVVEVKNRVREILQVNELVLIREYLINRASSATANKALQRTSR
ncbi:hypothetical protein [Shewanella litorisediminis]|uniref:Uncharacterized protein n=1 Tax=Shewanella litorisediminis TaxID=1173586 RepID=A0ABX7G1M8_9GAMM|nr:hypothetical protein [Shewanella litorisediminis]MCL2920040.1 hypothetical protein [Shewanella litorisediminis]QRH01160.1 hypothetical protein JQC75_15045 [Shewanella litorisediminis]